MQCSEPDRVNVLIETPTGVVWQQASRAGLSLDEYVRYVLRADWNKAHQNIDDAIARNAAFIEGDAQLARAADAYRKIPRQRLRNTWDRGRKSHTAPVYFCPDCLRTGEGELDLRWQLGFSCICVRHDRLLLNACTFCGELQRYRKGPGAGVHWLDSWRFCGACGGEIELAPHAPAWLREAAEMMGRPLDREDVMQTACYRFLAMLDSAPGTVASFAGRAGVPQWCDPKSWCACALLWATTGPGAGRDGSCRDTLNRFALVGLDPVGDVGSRLADLVCSC